MVRAILTEGNNAVKDSIATNEAILMFPKSVSIFSDHNSLTAFRGSHRVDIAHHPKNAIYYGSSISSLPTFSWLSIAGSPTNIRLSMSKSGSAVPVAAARANTIPGRLACIARPSTEA